MASPKNGRSKLVKSELQALREKLRRSKELCADFFESAAFGAARIAFSDGKFLQVNRTLCTMTGYSEKELLQKTLFGITHPDDLDRTMEVLETQSKANSPTRQIEKRLVCKAGHSIWVHVAKQIFQAGKSKPDYFAAIIVDISETKKSESQFSENFETLRLSQEVGKVGTFQWDPRTNQVLFTKSCHDLFDFPKDGFKVTLDAWRSRVHPQDLLEVESKRKQALDEKQKYFKTEYRVIVNDGAIRWIESRTRLFYDSLGRFIRMVGVHVDVTERKQAEQALQRSEAKAKARADELSAILDAVPTMLFIAHDPECKTMTSSRSAYEVLRLPHGANTSKTAPVGQRPENFTVLKDGQPIPEHQLPVQRAALTGKPIRNCEFVIAFDDGTSLDLFGHAVPLLDANGAVRGSVGAFMDITERRRFEELSIKKEIQEKLLEREILTRETERRRISRELHDEAGQMLASLLAGLQSVGTAKNFKTAKAHVKTLRNLTSRTIEGVGRLAQDLHPLVLDDLGLEIALRQYVAEYSELQGIPVHLKITGLEPKHLTEAMNLGIYRIAQEALTNVSKHAQAKKVVISIEVKSKQLTMKIADNGRGFVQTSNRTASKGHFGCQGMRERASIMGGSMKIDSRSGKGTTIVVTVPVSHSQRKDEAAALP
jgi:PAS domain S-box-containing protein